MIHLDTSFLVDLLREARRRKPARATAKLAELASEELGVSLFVLCELEAGAAGSARPEEERGRIRAAVSSLEVVLPGEEVAEHYGRQLAELDRSGASIAAMDLLIASTALADGAPLLTANRRHFDRVRGLEVLDY